MIDLFCGCHKCSCTCLTVLCAVLCCACCAVLQGEISVLPWTELEGLHRETSLIQVRLTPAHRGGGVTQDVMSIC
jgi:hypothetical protein